MASLTAQQANELANQFLALAQAIGDFRFLRWKQLTRAQHRKLATQHAAILRYGEDFLAMSTALVMNNVSTSLASIKQVTEDMKSTLDSMEDIQKGIILAAAIVKLGAVIMSKDPMAIGKAVESVVKKMKALP